MRCSGCFVTRTVENCGRKSSTVQRLRVQGASLARVEAVTGFGAKSKCVSLTKEDLAGGPAG